MRKVRSTLPAVLILALGASCAGRRSVAPVILYEGSPKPPAEISTIRIVGQSYPTINIRKLTRVDTSMRIVYQTRGEGAWTPPDHFGGLQATQKQAPEDDAHAIPHEFHLPPGMYRVEFTYVPVVDRWGWTHKPVGESVTWVECKAGYIYLLEGRMETVESGWSLVKHVLVAGEG